MKIAIVSSVFKEGSNYLEESLADELHLMGAVIQIFTSDLAFIESKPYPVKKIKIKLKFGSNLFVENLEKQISKFNPDKIIVLGISTFFTKSIFTKRIAEKYPIYAFVGHNSFMDNWKKNPNFISKIKSYLVHKIIKRNLYLKALKYARKIITYTPETKELLKHIVARNFFDKYEFKIANSNLGYNSHLFYFDEKIRYELREKFNLQDSKVIVHLSRIDKTKNIEKLIDIFKELRGKSNLNLKLILAGFSETKYKNEIINLSQKLQVEQDVLCFNYCENKLQNQIYCASDLAVYFKVGASIQQAFGTGIQVLLPNEKSCSHLLINQNSGAFIGDDILNQMLLLLERNSDRMVLAENFMQHFAYKNLIKKYLDLK
jgi:glycosyltransferase involved in cell wall biosynthesis